jgi:hypothetical protein
MKRKISWAAALTAAAGLAATSYLVPGAASAAAPQPTRLAAPALAWKPCDGGYQQNGTPFP